MDNLAHFVPLTARFGALTFVTKRECYCSCCQPQSMAEVLAKKEELADRLEKANEEAIASAIAEEEQLTREIQAENNELETDNESDFSVCQVCRDLV